LRSFWSAAQQQQRIAPDHRSIDMQPLNSWDQHLIAAVVHVEIWTRNDGLSELTALVLAVNYWQVVHQKLFKQNHRNSELASTKAY
jgi:hypothetical protein